MAFEDTTTEELSRSARQQRQTAEEFQWKGSFFGARILFDVARGYEAELERRGETA